MTTDRNTGAIPDWKLERYLLEELPPAEVRAIAARAETDAGLRSRLQTLRAGNEELLGRYPAAWMARRIQRRAEGPTAAPAGSWRVWLRPRLAAPAAVIALTAVALVSLPDGLVRQAPTPPPSPAAAPGVRVKGLHPLLVLYRKTPAGSERLVDGALARQGDRIRLQYQAAGDPYGAILSIDGRGTVTRHLPDRGVEAVPLQQGGPVPLPFSYELDDAPGRERFFFITGSEPFDVAAVEAVLRAREKPVKEEIAGAVPAASLGLPDSLGVYVFTVAKPAAAEAAR